MKTQRATGSQVAPPQVTLLILAGMKFLATCVYMALFLNKDTLIATTPGLGPKAIPVLKGVVMLGVAFWVSGMLGKVTARLRMDEAMARILLMFSMFFFLYACVLYPHREFFHLTGVETYLLGVVGSERAYYVGVITHWYHSLFFIASELWGSLMIMTLFWGVANSVSNLKQARASYALIALAGNMATFISSAAIYRALPRVGDFDTQTRALILASIVGSGLIYTLLRLLRRVSKPVAPPARASPRQRRSRASFFEAFQIVAQSPVLIAIFFVVAGFSYTMNLVEVFWKDALRSLYPDPSLYRTEFSRIMERIGILAIVVGSFVSVPLLRRASWTLAALIPPVLTGTAGLIFMAGYAAHHHPGLIPLLGVPTLAVVVSLGALHNVVAKVLKYSLFDPTKEMAYIPVSYDEKVRGKAAVDVLSSRLAKSGSSWSILLALELSNHLLSGAGALLLPVMIASFCAWAYGVVRLGIQIDAAEPSGPQS